MPYRGETYFGCMHTYGKHGRMFIRHFYDNDKNIYEVIWVFKYKRRNYEMVYWFKPNSHAVLYRYKRSRDLVMSFSFIPDWTPENCQEKISKLLAFA